MTVKIGILLSVVEVLAEVTNEADIVLRLRRLSVIEPVFAVLEFVLPSFDNVWLFVKKEELVMGKGVNVACPVWLIVRGIDRVDVDNIVSVVSCNVFEDVFIFNGEAEEENAVVLLTVCVTLQCSMGREEK